MKNWLKHAGYWTNERGEPVELQEASMVENGNASIYFVDRHANGAVAENTAFIEADGLQRSLTYKQLAEQSGCLAELFQRHGIGSEQRVAMLVLDQLEFPIIFWGSIKAGVVPVALNTLLATDLYTTILQDSRATALCVSHELYDTVAPAIAQCENLKSVFVIGGATPDNCLNFTTELSVCKPRPAVHRSADECAFWLYSSGSTGSPKGVMHVHGSLQATADTYGKQVLQINADDVVYSAAKLFFAYGLGNAMTFPMSVGATVYLLSSRPTPDSVFNTIRVAQPTVFCGVPTLFAAMLASMDGKAPVGGDRLRCCISAGVALPEDLGVRWQVATGIDILDGVGSTELLHIFLSNQAGNVVYGTSGTAVPGYDLRLLGENNEEVPAGSIGELVVRGQSAAMGYWNQRYKSRTTFEGEWTRTGDKYERRDDGRLVYCGRTDDMFKVSGIWVSPFEVEQALVAHASVLEAAVVPARSEDGLEKPKAFVVLQADAQDDNLDMQLKDHVKDKIGKWKYPRWIEFVTELPKTATGKIQRFKLR